MRRIEYVYDWPGERPQIGATWSLFPALKIRQPQGKVSRTELGGEAYYVTAEFDAAHAELFFRAHPELGIGEL